MGDKTPFRSGLCSSPRTDIAPARMPRPLAAGSVCPSCLCLPGARRKQPEAGGRGVTGLELGRADLPHGCSPASDPGSGCGQTPPSLPEPGARSPWWPCPRVAGRLGFHRDFLLAPGVRLEWSARLCSGPCTRPPGVEDSRSAGSSGERPLSSRLQADDEGTQCCEQAAFRLPASGPLSAAAPCSAAIAPALGASEGGGRGLDPPCGSG